MRLSKRILLPTIFLTLLVSSSLAFAQTSNPLAVKPQDRLVGAIDSQVRLPLRGHVHPALISATELGAVDPAYPMQRMILLLNSSPEQQAALDQLVAAQHDPKSPLYHHFLTPQEFGAHFGASSGDIKKVTSWLNSYGFTVNEVPASRRALVFSGTAEQVSAAFHTEIHQYRVNGELHHANSAEPQIPLALAGLVRGVVRFHDFYYKPAISSFRPAPEDAASPQYTSGGSHLLAPADYATIYNINPLYSSGIDGAGQSIALVGRSNLNMTDIQTFRTQSGLPVNNPTIVLAGNDPGFTGDGEAMEAMLDAEWAGAVAPKATIKFVVAASTGSADGVDLAAQYAVNKNVAPVLSLSFGACEASMGSGATFYSNLWQQAAAQGITVFVSSGDSGAAGCQQGGSSSGSGRGVNGLCSTPYSVCVGGTQFNEGSNPGQYWQPGNNSVLGSAISYIPETVWNESGSTGGSGLWASGGGASIKFTKPSWQTGPGVPADGQRDVPDVSLTAAGHDGYIVIFNGKRNSVGGTSASSPSFAGLMALVNQKNSGLKGNINTVLYPLAAKQASGGSVIFHDTVTGNNSVPGVSGFSAGPGYDLATGLGSVDATALVNHWNNGSGSVSPSFGLAASPASLTVAPGQSGSSTVTTTLSGTFNAAVALTVSGLPTGVTAAFTPATIPAPGAGTSNLALTVASTAKAGSYTLTITGQGGSVTKTTTVTLNVGTGAQSGCTLTAAPSSLNAAIGQTVSTQISCSAVQGTFTSSLNLSLGTKPQGVSAALSSPAIVPGTGVSTLAVTPGSTAIAGSYTLTVTASNSTGFSQTLSIPLTISQTSSSGFRLTPSNLNPTVAPGQSVRVTITSAHIGSFNSAVSLSPRNLPCGLLVRVSPATIPAPGDGTSTFTLQAAPSMIPGTYTMKIVGHGGGTTATATLTLTVKPASMGAR